MQQFLINLAIFNTNWNRSSQSIVDQFMPLVGHAIAQLDDDIVSQENLRAKLLEVAEFEIPRGAVEQIIRRAAKPRYEYLIPQGGLYRRNLAKIPELEFQRVRDEVEARHSDLRRRFVQYCKDKLGREANEDEAERYFFEVLSEIAPKLIEHIAGPQGEPFTIDLGKDKAARFMTHSFVQYCYDRDQDSFELIKDFVQGAVLAESFYYTNPESLTHRLRDVDIFFDTDFIVRLLGYSDSEISMAARELHGILSAMNARLRYFERTKIEVIGILTAAERAARANRLFGRRPGDVFDYFGRKGATSADIQFQIANLERSLAKLNLRAVVPPPHEEELGLHEAELENAIRDQIPSHSTEAMDHDVRCLIAVHTLRGGKPQKYFESCKAIFVTKNNGLARAATLFFNAEIGVSDAPICISDNVFTMLMWLKAVDKKPNLPINRIIANSVAALQPSQRVWDDYLKEIERLRSSGEITQEEYANYAYSVEARDALMFVTAGDENALTEGSVKSVLARAHQLLFGEKEREIAARDQEIRDVREARLGELERARQRLEALRTRTAQAIYAGTAGILILLITIVTIVSIGGWLGAAIGIAIAVMGAVGSVLGWSASDWMRRFASDAATAIHPDIITDQ